MEDIIDIIVTETTNLIEITSQPTDEIIDVNIIDNREDVTLNVTPTVVEININSLTGNFGINWGEIDGTLSNQTDLNTALGLKADLVGGKVPSSQLPSYVDDVIEVANYAALPATGETGKIYITIDTNYIYRWTGSVYVEIKDSSAVWGAITGTLSNQTDLQNALNAKANDNAVVHNTGNESVAGLKTFTSGISADYLWIKEGTGLANPSGYAQLATDLTYFHFNNSNNTAFARFLYGSGQRTYTLPDSNGTIALTSDLHNAVTIGTANGLSLSTQVLSLGLASSSANGALSSTDWSTFKGKKNALSGNGFVKISGSTISYDNSTYLTTSSAASTYLPLSGGTLTGALNGTSGTFTGNVSTSAQLRIESSGNALLLIGSRTSGTVFEVYNSSNILRFYNGTVDALQITTGSGAATFSSSVTAGAQISIGNFDGQALKMQAGTSTGNSFLRFYNSASTPRGYFGLFNSGGTDYMLLDGSSTDVSINGNANLNLQTGGNNRLNITSSGNVGIGTTSPSTTLHVLGRIRSSNTSTIGTGVASGIYELGDSSNGIWRGDANSTTTAGNFTNIGGYDGIIFTSSNASMGSQNERMRITSSGNVGIGTTSPSYKLSIVGDLRGYKLISSEAGVGAGNYTIFSNDDNVGYIDTIRAVNSGDFHFRFDGTSRANINRTTGIYMATSDSALKTNILDSKNVLPLIDKIKVRSYNWIENNAYEPYGLIAQELNEILPEYVYKPKTESESWGLSKAELVPVLIKAIQELKSKIETLENK